MGLLSKLEFFLIELAFLGCFELMVFFEVEICFLIKEILAGLTDFPFSALDGTFRFFVDLK